MTAHSSATAQLRKVVTDAQDILARYIVPDSGISEHECVNQLLGLLDGPQTREAMTLPNGQRYIGTFMGFKVYEDPTLKESEFRVQHDGQITNEMLELEKRLSTRSETGVREAVIEECAALIDPGPNPPCGCLRPGSYGGCDCGNVGNTQQEESYWTSKGDAERIRTLKGKP